MVSIDKLHPGMRIKIVDHIDGVPEWMRQYTDPWMGRIVTVESVERNQRHGSVEAPLITMEENTDLLYKLAFRAESIECIIDDRDDPMDDVDGLDFERVLKAGLVSG